VHSKDVPKAYFNMRSSSTPTVLICHLIALTRAFSADISIVGQAGGAPQKLPGSYVKTFTRWSVEEISSDSPTLQRLPTEGDDSFVNPTSTEEVWWPMDLKKLQVRPCLDVLMQNGQPKYAMAGLTVRVPENASGDGVDWRNYGLNSQPLAGQWTTFAFAVEGGFRVECFVGTNDAETPTETKDASKDDSTMLYERIFPGDLGALNERPSAHAMFASERMSEALESLGVFLSGIDDSSPLSNGFHLVSFPLTRATDDWIELPKLKSEKGYTLLCVATAEPDAEKLLEMDEGLVQLTATSVLQVDVLPTASGSESEYLPASYKPLYNVDQ